MSGTSLSKRPQVPFPVIWLHHVISIVIHALQQLVERIEVGYLKLGRQLIPGSDQRMGLGSLVEFGAIPPAVLDPCRHLGFMLLFGHRRAQGGMLGYIQWDFTGRDRDQLGLIDFHLEIQLGQCLGESFYDIFHLTRMQITGHWHQIAMLTFASPMHQLDDPGFAQVISRLHHGDRARGGMIARTTMHQRMGLP